MVQKKEAATAMKNFVKEVKKLDLSTEKDKLIKLLGPEGPLVAKVIEMSKNPEKVEKG